MSVLSMATDFPKSGRGLTGFGTDETEALETLEAGVRAWAETLAKKGLLEDALARASLRKEHDGLDEVTIEIQVAEEAAR